MSGFLRERNTCIPRGVVSVRLPLRAARQFQNPTQNRREVRISAVDSRSDLLIFGHFLAVRHNEGVHS
jgi:hypothetical protein